MPPQRPNVENLVNRLWTPEGPAVVMDGGVGTEFRDRYRAMHGRRLIPVLWSATALMNDVGQDILYEVHRDFIVAGAELIIANTFRTQSETFQAAKYPDYSREATRDAVEIALQARNDGQDPSIVVAYSAAPLNDCYKPIPGRFSQKQLENGHYKHAKNAAEAGAEIAVCETLPSWEEAAAAIKGAKAVGLRAIVGFYTPDGVHLPDGTPIQEAAYNAAEQEAEAVVTNCVRPKRGRDGVALMMSIEGFHTPTGTYVQGYEHGCPEAEPGIAVADYPDHVRDQIRQCIRLGARLVGGCCNVRPADIANIKQIAQQAANQPSEMQVAA